MEEVEREKEGTGSWGEVEKDGDKGRLEGLPGWQTG